ncbi:hypothetical protein ID866_7689 [Astraeus odoratus]|nr:hypothetical protein ID866_7689 [Astraeus odoratus]
MPPLTTLSRILVIFSALRLIWAIQDPLYIAPSHTKVDLLGSSTYPAGFSDGDTENWQFEVSPHSNSTDHLIFETVYSLLQHWPNTRMRNGHTIVPGTIPTGTLLYHGAMYNRIPTTPDWVAMDPEESTFFCMNPSDEGCWHLTLSTTRPLKIIYFDGSSAANMDAGCLDTQDIITWGKILPEKTFMEEERINALCRWGEQYGVDGFVRMEMDFEAMLCNFTSGVQVVSFVKLANPDPLEIPPPDSSRSFPRIFESLHSGSWYNRFPGDTRIKLDLTGLVSFYDTELVPSLVSARSGTERWNHRLQNISDNDVLKVKARLEESLMRQETCTSGVDWMSLFRVIVIRYAERLELTQYLLNTSMSNGPSQMMAAAKLVQIQLRVMLMPYIFFSAVPEEGSESIDWAQPIFKLCATSHTESIASSSCMTPSEQLLLRAAEQTTKEICRVVTRMWASGVLLGLDRYLNSEADVNTESVSALVRKWKNEISGLTQWLDWSIWVKCQPECGPEEICYMSTWPVGFPPTEQPIPPPDDGPYIPYPKPPPEMPIAPDWERPQPRCLRRIEPYELF